MTLKNLFKKVTTSQDDVDRKKLLEFCGRCGVTTTIGDMEPRQEATVAGQIASLRIVPSSTGSPWLEATVQDGTGSLVVLWTGRRRIAGIRPGCGGDRSRARPGNPCRPERWPRAMGHPCWTARSAGWRSDRRRWPRPAAASARSWW